MKQPFYDYTSENERLWFEFESVSDRKTVRKIVIYTPFDDDPTLYNLALVDAFPDGSFSDKSVSNNDDLEKVMATVIQTLLRFFEGNPSAMVYIEGSTAERTRLYRIAIRREFSEIDTIFTVYGVTDSDTEPFVPNQNYQAFVIALKNRENLLKRLYENGNS